MVVCGRVIQTLQGAPTPLISLALIYEYEDVLERERLFRNAPISRDARFALFFALMKVSRWTSIYFLWRPNLSDEADNHLIELALAGGARAVITANKRDLAGGELAFSGLSVQTAGEFLVDYERSMQ